ncbi:outer membrane autotransporter [Xylanimonas cellulosilytica DSM 15894]|uniref:Outer membrane autotransporter n=2 Tax=Xylanimonas TaxID=186188 RepID=D1BSC2_XYLCX|nr:outer membrane autotransporter [Xylanimonas cellulosilytica DSM 15894]
MHRFMRKLAVVGVAGAIGVGGVAMASPALAGTWSGTMTCPGSIFVKSTGTKGGTGSITVYAAGHSFTYSTQKTGVQYTVVGAYSSGSWSVSGAGATAGIGYCGT